MLVFTMYRIRLKHKLEIVFSIASHGEFGNGYQKIARVLLFSSLPRNSSVTELSKLKINIVNYVFKVVRMSEITFVLSSGFI